MKFTTSNLRLKKDTIDKVNRQMIDQKIFAMSETDKALISGKLTKKGRK